jgi:hypothetical protein
MASVMGVNHGWLRGLIYQKVMDDERERREKGSPHLMHVQQTFQALIARRMRERAIGYDLIRDAVWDLEIDRQKIHDVEVAEGIKLVLNKSLLLMKARALFKQGHDFEYRADEERAA